MPRTRTHSPEHLTIFPMNICAVCLHGLSYTPISDKILLQPWTEKFSLLELRFEAMQEIRIAAHGNNTEIARNRYVMRAAVPV